MSSKKIKRVCVIDSMHSLLLYFLLSDIEDIKKTYFFWGDGITNRVKSFFKDSEATLDIWKIDRVNGGWFTQFISYFGEFYYYKIYFPFRWPFIMRRDIEYWGVDHLNFSRYIFRNHSYKVLEDGLANYKPLKIKSKTGIIFDIIRVFIGNNWRRPKRFFGDSVHTQKIYLTGLSTEGEVLGSPCKQIIDSDKIWSCTTIDKKKYINLIMDISEKDIEICKNNKNILLTQPFSEDNVLTEQEKIQLYREIIERVPGKKVIIKPHPRERTNYEAVFPNTPVLLSKAPMELYSLNGIKFEAAYTVFSTALFAFHYNLKLYFLGSSFHPKLYNRFPLFTQENFLIDQNKYEIVKM